MKDGGSRKRQMKNAGFFSILILIGLIVYSVYANPKTLTSVALSDVVSRANSGEISKLEITGNTVEVTKKGDKEPTEKAFKENGSSIYEQGLNKDAPVTVDPKAESTGGDIWVVVLQTLIPVLIFGFFLMMIFRASQGQGNQALSFGKSKARLYGNEKTKVTF